MSDLLELHADVQDAADRRYEDTVTVDGEEYDVLYRQSRDAETSAFISTIGKEKFDEWEEKLEVSEADEEEMKRMQKLSQKKQNGRLSDSEEDELDSLKEQYDGAQDGIYDLVTDPDAVAALQDVACKVVEPDEEDIQTILEMSPEKQKSRFGEYATDENAAYDMAKSLVEDIVVKSTNFSSVILGMKGLNIGQSGGNDQN